MIKKLKSTKFLITIWAILMITYIVIAGKDNFYGIAQLLCSIPLSYVVANVAQKAIYNKLLSICSTCRTRWFSWTACTAFLKKVNSFALIWYSGNNFIPLHWKQDVLFIRAMNETSSCQYSYENIDKTLRV